MQTTSRGPNLHKTSNYNSRLHVLERDIPMLINPDLFFVLSQYMENRMDV